MDLSKYYLEICKEPILSKIEEQELMVIYKGTKSTEKEKKKAKDRIIKSNLRFVFKQAKNYSKNDPHTFEELISAGNEGLLVGLEKYDPARKIRFLTYAGWWVIQRILKEMSKMRIVSLPIWKQQLASRIAKMKDTNETLSVADVQKEFPAISEKDIRELFDTKYLTYYIDDLEENNIEIDSIANTVERDHDNKTLLEAVDKLPSPHKEIMILSYGLEDGRELAFTQLAKRLVLTREQLKQLKKEALNMLKVELSAQ